MVNTRRCKCLLAIMRAFWITPLIIFWKECNNSLGQLIMMRQGIYWKFFNIYDFFYYIFQNKTSLANNSLSAESWKNIKTFEFSGLNGHFVDSDYTRSMVQLFSYYKPTFPIPDKFYT